jgi:D-sedoheptulose 7-phosphate isomerase
MSIYQKNLREAIEVIESLKDFEAGVGTAANWCIEALASGGKLLICGNGGSAAEAQHLAGELMGRYKQNRAPLAAITLGADAAVMTCIGNDYSFDEAFARQLRALGRAGDVLIAFTTSGASPNVLKALAAAKDLGLKTVAFLGRDGGEAGKLADCALVVRHWDTARVQEGHQFLMHALMDAIEAGRTGPGESE